MTWALLVALWLLLMLVVLAFFAGARMLSDEDGESPLRTDETPQDRRSAARRYL